MTGAIKTLMSDSQIAQQCVRSLEALISKLNKFGTDGDDCGSEYVKGYLEGVVEYLKMVQRWNEQANNDRG